MSPEQAKREIERTKRDYKEHWERLIKSPRIQEALARNDPIKLNEWASRIVYGNTPTKEELEAGRDEGQYHEDFKRRQKLIGERMEQQMNTKKPGYLEAVFSGGDVNGKTIWVEKPFPIFDLVQETRLPTGETICTVTMTYKLVSDGPPLRYELMDVAERSK